MQECTKMFQIGWSTLTDYKYVIQWLSTSNIEFNNILKNYADIKKAEEYSESLEVKDRSSKNMEIMYIVVNLNVGSMDVQLSSIYII